MNPIRIGAKIRALRGAESQQALADKLKISKSALAMYERGERVPRDEVKIRIVQHFNIPLESIFLHQLSTNCAERRTYHDNGLRPETRRSSPAPSC